MKKVIYIITKSNWGGAGRYVFDLATHLPKTDFEPKVICGGQGKLAEKLSKHNIPIDCIKTMKRDMNLGGDCRSFFKIFQILKKERPHIIHLNSPKAAGLGSVAGRLLGIKKIIYTVHGFTFNEERNWFEKVCIKLFSWITILLSHHTILLSQIELNQVKHWPFIKKKLSVIPLGIDAPEHQTRQEARETLENILHINLNNKFIVGTIAELHKNKGYQYAIDAISQLKEIVYIIIGDGDEREYIKKYIQENKIKNIFCAGLIENASKLMKTFDIFLLPSVKEGLPYTLLEAGFLEIPIISTDVGGIPTLIKNGVYGTLIPPKNSEAIRNAIKSSIQTSSPERDVMPHRFRQYIEEIHTLKILLKGVICIYNK